MEIDELSKSFSIVFAEMVHLKYSFFLKMLAELNSIAEYFIDDQGNRLSFKIVQGSDKTFLWKLTVRIACSKSKISDDDSASYSPDKTLQTRYLRLNQFVNIYNHIKQQSEVLKTFDSSETACSKETASIMTDSKLYDA